MLSTLVTVIFVSAFFVLFFEPRWNLKNKREKKIKKRRVPEVSTTHGFVEDTDDAFIIPMYPSQLIKKDSTGKNIPIYGKVGTFKPYSSIPENNWLHGFPHKKA